MAVIVTYPITIQSAATYTSGIDLGSGEFTRFAICCPQITSVFTTENVNVQVQGSPDGGSTFYTIGYSNNPATSTSGFKAWQAGIDVGGSMVICEAALFSPIIRLSFTSACTTTGTFYILAGKGI